MISRPVSAKARSDMKDSQRRIEMLVRRAAAEREDLAAAVGELAGQIDRRRTLLRVGGWIAGGLAAAVMGAYKLFGKGSLASIVGRYSSAASLVLGLGRAAMQLRRFF